MNIAAAFAKYHTTINSGTAWLGDIPADWGIKKMKFLFRDHSQKEMPNAELLSVTQNQGVVPRTLVESRMVMPSGNLKSFKFIEKGDFAISLRSFEGGLEYCHHDGIISPAYTVLKRKSENLLPAYYRYLFKSAAFISELQTSIVGIREGKNISFEELSYSLMPVPGLNEQRAIAAFLDSNCAKIDEAVRIKEAQIKLLSERRQILIQQAVTRGLNPDVPMKDSGTDWIVEIPVHWSLVPILAVGEVIDPNPSHRNPEYVDEGFPFISTQEFRPGGVIEIDTPRRVSKNTVEEQEKRCHFGKGSLVFSRKGTIGAVRVLPIGIRLGILDSLCVINPNRRVDPTYLFWSLSSDYLPAQYGPTLRGAALPQLSVGRVRSLKIILPPKNEQSEIVQHLKRETGKVDTAILIKQEQIAKLKEYKTSLINAAVTGKIKVI